MNIPVHRNTDSRSCGAKTTVSGQANVFVNNLLASVQGDRSTHGDGALGATVNDGTVYLNNKKLVLKGSNASPDALCAPQGGQHCNPKSVGASANVFACGGGSGGSIGGSPDEAMADPSRSDLYPDPAVTRNADGSPLDGDKNADGTTNQADQNFDDGSSPGYPDDLSNAELEQIIRDEAGLRGIDPDTAVAIYRAEGAGSYQSTIPRNGSGSLNGREASFGPYQLYTGAGLGNEYETATGRILTEDNTRDGVTNQVRFALDEAATGGWGPWYGRGPAGVGEFEGVSGAQPIRNWN
jgi:hypothetical protein